AGAGRWGSVEDVVPALAHAVAIRVLEALLRPGPLLEPATDAAGGASTGGPPPRVAECRPECGARAGTDQATGHRTAGRCRGRVSRDLQSQGAALLHVSADVLGSRAAECVDGRPPRLLGRAPGTA